MYESGENYLETIYMLQKEQGFVRSIDIVEYMGYSKPSVSRAVGLLKNGGYITVNRDGYISLTDVGLETAKKIFERHTVISTLLEKLGVKGETAAEDACRIEHDISHETFIKLKKYIEKEKR